MIKALFVDDRLLHGRIALKWASHYHLTKILVANDETYNDEFTKMILDLAKPKSVSLQISEVNSSFSIINDLMKQKENVIVIVSNLFDAKQIIDNTNDKIEINITGLRERLNSYKVNSRVALNREDISIIIKMVNNGISIKLQTVPDEEKIVFDENYIDFLINKI